MIEQLLARGNQIRDESQDSANTNVRVGEAYNALVRKVPQDWSATLAYPIDSWVIWRGELRQALSAVMPGQSPATHPALWNDFIPADVTTIRENTPPGRVNTRILAQYVAYALSQYNRGGFQSLAQTTQAGAVTTDEIETGGLRSKTFPTAQTVLEIFGAALLQDGSKQAVTVSINQLQTMLGLSNATHPPPVVAPPRYQARRHYQPATTPNPSPTPGAPSRLTGQKGLGSAPEAILLWDLSDTLATGIQLQVQNPDGTWGAITDLPAGAKTATVGGLTWGQSYTWRVRAITATFQSGWSNTATVRISTYTFSLGLYGTGQPPVFLSILNHEGELVRPAGAANLGVLVRDRQGNPPTTADFDRTICYVTLPDGSRAGWDPADTNAGPSPSPLFLFPRPGGMALPVGLYTVTVRLFQGQYPVGNAIITTRLLPVLTAPLAPSGLTATRQANGDTLLTWTDNADNENYQTIEYRIGTGPWENLSVVGPNTTTATMQGLSSAGITYSLRIIAGNLAGVSAPSNVAVLSPNQPGNRPPILPVFPGQQAFIGEFFSYTLPVAVDPDGDAITYAMQGLAQGLSFAPATRTVSGTPTGSPISLTTTVTATDALGAASSGGLLIALAGRANRLPVPPTLPDRVSVSGVAVAIILPPFTDPDGDPLTYSAQGLPPGLVFDPATRTVSGTPAGTPTLTVTYAASDNRGGSYAASFEWRITAPANRPPVAPVLPSQTFGRSVAVSYQVPAFTDPDGDALTYSASGLPPGMSLNAARQLVGIASTVATYVATITASDGRGGVTSADQTIVILAPAITVIQVRSRIVAGDTTALRRVQVEATLNGPGEVEWQLIAPDGYEFPWQASLLSDGPRTTSFQYSVSDPNGAVTYRLRPTENPTAISGDYSIGHGGSALRDWQIITLS